MGVQVKNIDMFDIFTGYIFKELYENFPVCFDVNTTDVVEKINGEMAKYDTDKKELIFSETMFWLQDSGFITFKAPGEKVITMDSGVCAFPSFMCCVLTAKGLEVLKKVPKAITKRKTIGEELSEAVKGGMRSKISEYVGVALSQVIKETL
jgi:hypothetical protein